MNIEELELSLRTEFESQVRNVLAGIKQDVADFQEKFKSELEEHRTKLDRTIDDLSSRVPATLQFDAAFNESVNEHLRLARDDGAQVAATAFGEAEKLRADAEQPVGGFDLMRDAIAEISSKSSQATILQSLVSAASKFAPRGAFFIVKNDHFVGWKTFGPDAPADERVRDLLFSVSDDSVLSASIQAMGRVSQIEGSSSENAFLNSLGFGRPAEMHAIPLRARGRGVAVLYADAGNGGSANVEALETLVSVAGLTVELLAASQTAPSTVPAPSANEGAAEETKSYTDPEATHEPASAYAEPATGAYETETFDQVEQIAEVSEAVTEFAVKQNNSWSGAEVAEVVAERETEYASSEYVGEVTYELEPTSSPAAVIPTVEAPEIESFQPVAETFSEPESDFATSDFAISSNNEAFAYDSGYEAETVAEVVEGPVPMVEAPAVAAAYTGSPEVATVVEPMVEVAAAEPKKSRFSDRNVDLPIEVADDERKLHNDARRFARLLVSEIKLYNEQKVTEGRENGNLYQQLKEAIDRSREMYDKRVQPTVASKFDYFHYEVVNSLAEGQDAKLGVGYPGATV